MGGVEPFQSLEGFMVDGNFDNLQIGTSVTVVSIPRRVYG